MNNEHIFRIGRSGKAPLYSAGDVGRPQPSAGLLHEPGEKKEHRALQEVHLQSGRHSGVHLKSGRHSGVHL